MFKHLNHFGNIFAMMGFFVRIFNGEMGIKNQITSPLNALSKFMINYKVMFKRNIGPDDTV